MEQVSSPLIHVPYLFARTQRDGGKSEAVRLTLHRIGTELGLNPEEILKTSHGRRSIDIFKIVAPHKATWDCTRFSPFHLSSCLGGASSKN